MGLTQKLGTIPLAISTDASNNVGIGGSPSGSYKLEVTGTAKVSSTLLVSGALTGAGEILTSGGQLAFSGSGSVPSKGIGIRYNGTFYVYAGANGFNIRNSANSANNLVVTDAGNVGIGTSSPGAKLAVQGNSGTDGFGFFMGGAGSTLGGIKVGNDGSTYGSLYFDNATNDVLLLQQYSSGSLRFGTNSAERMRITSGGQVQVKQAGNTHSDGFSLINTAGNAWNFVTGGDNQLYFGLAGTSRGNFATNGVYTATSDINKKKDFEVSTIGLNAVLGLKPTLYRMKDEDEALEKHLGFIAQEVKEFIPQAYSESKNGDELFIGLTEMPIIAALVKSVQEQNQTIQNLQEQNQDLKSRLDKAGL